MSAKSKISFFSFCFSLRRVKVTGSTPYPVTFGASTLELLVGSVNMTDQVPSAVVTVLDVATCSAPPFAATFNASTWLVQVGNLCAADSMLGAVQLVVPAGGFAQGTTISWTIVFSFVSSVPAVSMHWQLYAQPFANAMLGYNATQAKLGRDSKFGGMQAAAYPVAYTTPGIGGTTGMGVVKDADFLCPVPATTTAPSTSSSSEPTPFPTTMLVGKGASLDVSAVDVVLGTVVFERGSSCSVIVGGGLVRVSGVATLRGGNVVIHGFVASLASRTRQSTIVRVLDASAIVGQFEGVTVAGAPSCGSGSLQTVATLEQTGATLSAVITVTGCPAALSVGAMAGIAVGCVALVACLFVLLLVYKRVSRNVMLRRLQSGDVPMNKNPHFVDDTKDGRAGKKRGKGKVVVEESAFWKRYVKIDEVGKTLCKAVDSANKNEVVMIKVLPRRVADVSPSEIQVLCRLNHPHIVRLLDTVDDRPHSVCMLLEYLIGGDLRTCRLKLGPFPEALARACFRDVVSGLSYLHGSLIVHRNIKAANCVLNDEGVVKLVDFGLAARFTEDKLFYDFCGMPSHDAPEIRQLMPYHGPPADIWALGVTLYEILTAVPPFGERPFQFDLPSMDDLPRHVALLLGQLWHEDPRKREQASMIMGNDWFHDKFPLVDPSEIMHSGLRQRILREGERL